MSQPVCPRCSEPPGSTLACLACGAILEEPEGASHFARLGVEPSEALDNGALEARYLKLSRLLHPDHQADADEETRERALRHSALLNDAWRVLTNDQLRGEYLVELLDPGVLDRNKSLSPDFLMEAMEISEELEQAQQEGCHETIERIADRVRGEIACRMAGVSSGCRETIRRIAAEAPRTHPAPLDAGREGPPHEWDGDDVATLLHQSRVYRRILRDTKVTS